MAGFNEFMQGILKGAGDIANEFANSGFYKNVIPTSDEFTRELLQGINSNQKAKIDYLQDALDNAVKYRAKPPLKKAGLDNETIENVSQQIANALHGTDYSDEAISKLADIMKSHNINDKMVNTFINNTSDSVQEVLSQNIVSLVNGTTHPVLYAKTYFNNPDPKIKQQRIAAVVGAYGTLAVGGRLLSGGTITEDNYGRRDIAGIPFI